MVYKPFASKPLSRILPEDVLSNQRILSGIDPECLISNGIFFIDGIISANTISIKDGKGQTIINGLKAGAYCFPSNPIRCDYGVKIEGEPIMVKGFAVFGVLPE